MHILSQATADRWYGLVGLISIFAAFLSFMVWFAIKHRHWSKVTGIAIFLAFLATGATYYLGGVRDDYSNAQLKDTNDRLKNTTQKLSETTDKLSKTDQQLTRTTEQLELNRADAEAARADAALAHASAAEASGRTVLIQQDNLKLQKDLEVEKEKTRGVEASIAPRELTGSSVHLL